MVVENPSQALLLQELPLPQETPSQALLLQELPLPEEYPSQALPLPEEHPSQALPLRLDRLRSLDFEDFEVHKYSFQ